jgi:hypothetical protein
MKPLHAYYETTAEAIEPDLLDLPIDEDADESEIDAGMEAISDSHYQLSKQQDKLVTSLEDHTSLNKLVTVFKQSLAKDGLSPTAAKIADSYLLRHDTLARPIVSLEHYSDIKTRVPATRVSLEGVKDVLTTVKNGIMTLIKAIRDAVVLFFKKVSRGILLLGGQINKIGRAAKKLKEEEAHNPRKRDSQVLSSSNGFLIDHHYVDLVESFALSPLGSGGTATVTVNDFEEILNNTRSLLTTAKELSVAIHDTLLNSVIPKTDNFIYESFKHIVDKHGAEFTWENGKEIWEAYEIISHNLLSPLNDVYSNLLSEIEDRDADNPFILIDGLRAEVIYLADSRSTPYTRHDRDKQFNIFEHMHRNLGFNFRTIGLMKEYEHSASITTVSAMGSFSSAAIIKHLFMALEEFMVVEQNAEKLWSKMTNNLSKSALKSKYSKEHLELFDTVVMQPIYSKLLSISDIYTNLAKDVARLAIDTIRAALRYLECSMAVFQDHEKTLVKTRSEERATFLKGDYHLRFKHTNKVINSIPSEFANIRKNALECIERGVDTSFIREEFRERIPNLVFDTALLLLSSLLIHLALDADLALSHGPVEIKNEFDRLDLNDRIEKSTESLKKQSLKFSTDPRLIAGAIAASATMISGGLATGLLINSTLGQIVSGLGTVATAALGAKFSYSALDSASKEKLKKDINAYLDQCEVQTTNWLKNSAEKFTDAFDAFIQEKGVQLEQIEGSDQEPTA